MPERKKKHTHVCFQDRKSQTKVFEEKMFLYHHKQKMFLSPESHNFHKFSVNLEEKIKITTATVIRPSNFYASWLKNRDIIPYCSIELTPVSSFTSLTAPENISSDCQKVQNIQYYVVSCCSLI